MGRKHRSQAAKTVMVAISDVDRENFQRDGFLKVETWHKEKTTDDDYCCRNVDYCLHLFGMLVYWAGVVLHMICLYYDSCKGWSKAVLI